MQQDDFGLTWDRRRGFGRRIRKERRRRELEVALERRRGGDRRRGKDRRGSAHRRAAR